MSELATQNPQRELIQTLRSETFQAELAAALPENVTPQRFVRIAVTALQATPDIVKCEPASILRAMIESAQMGLMPDGSEAALVAFGGKATLIPMVGGYRKIAAEHGWSIRSAVVYENDEFEYELGLDLRLTHRPAGLREERGDVVGAYAIGSHRDGRKEVEVMTRAEIEKVRQVSRAKDRGPWKDWFERMVEKTPVRRLFPKLALDPNDAQRVTRILESVDNDFAGDSTALLYGPERAQLSEGSPVSPSFPADEPSRGDGEGSQQAEGDGAAAAPSVPDTDDPEPPVGDQTAFQIPEAAIDEAATFVIPRGERLGKSLAEVAADGDEAFLAWALRRAPSYWSDPFRAALELFVEHRLPDVWSTFLAEREAA